MATVVQKTGSKSLSLHGLGVICGLTAGVWLGAAEAPTKLVNSGLSPFAISLCMVAGVFTARWTVPTLLKGTGYVFADLAEKKHLIVWAILAGMLWAVANTLTVFAIRDVGLAIAFPLWNTNSLVGIFWGRAPLRRTRRRQRQKHRQGRPRRASPSSSPPSCSASAPSTATPPPALTPFGGILAAIGASLMWGTMYIPYRKAYISGMNPLSFVTVFTIGELGTVFALVLALDGGTHAAVFHLLHQPRLALLALPRRLRLGHRRPLPAVRHQVPRHRPRHPALQHQPALGTRLGRARLRRTRQRRLADTGCWSSPDRSS